MFHLHIEFSGPCLFVLDQDDSGITQQVGVLIPDCRGVTHKDPKHQDGDPAELHVGYIRLDMGDLESNPRFPHGTAEDQPKYELVHRFTGQELDFVPALAKAPVDVSRLHLPSVNEFAPRLELKTGPFGINPPGPLVTRMILRGGAFFSDPQSFWMLSPVLHPDGKCYVVECASTVTWRCPIDGDRLTIKVTDFDKVPMDKPEALFNLGPFTDGEIVTLSVGNICATNPLDWSDLPTRKVTAIDEDFKWIYRLLCTIGSPTVDLPPGAKLPAPVLVATVPDETGDEACMGATILGKV